MEPTPKLPIGAEVKHKRHGRTGTIIGYYYNTEHRVLYYYAMSRGGQCTWAEYNLELINMDTNKAAKSLLSKEW